MEALIVFVLVVLTPISVVTSQSCSSFTYTQHPPTPLTCKPYSNGPSPTWQLRTNCAVERDTTNTEAFEIHWIHRDSNGVEEDLGLPSFNSYNPSIPIAQSNGPRLANTPFTEDMVGQYWCQVFLGGTPIPVYSNVITVLRPEEYDSQIPVCQSSLLQVVGTMICNDDPPPPLSIASSSNPPPSIPSSSSSSSNLPSSILTPSSTVLPAEVTTSVNAGGNIVPQAITTTSNIPSPAESAFTSHSSTSTTSHLEPSVTTLLVSPALLLSTRISTTQLPIQSTSTISTSEQSQAVVTNVVVTNAVVITTVNTVTSFLQSDQPMVTNNEDSSVTMKTVSRTADIPNQSVSVVPEGREEMSEMSYLLLTAIALIVILSILIILLLIIAYMMKCGRPHRRRKKQATVFSAPRRTSSTELLDMNTDQDTLSTFSTIDYTSSLTPQHVAVATKPNNIKQHIPHSYSTINETSTGMDSTMATNDTLSGRSFNFQLKPPAILRSKSPSLNGSLHINSGLSQSLLSTPNHKVYPINNNTFQYSVMTDNNKHSSEDSRVYNVEVQNGARSNSEILKKTETSAKQNAHKLRTRQMSDATELDSWDNQLQDNPMYMKLPVGLRVINTL